MQTHWGTHRFQAVLRHCLRAASCLPSQQSEPRSQVFYRHPCRARCPLGGAHALQTRRYRTTRVPNMLGNRSSSRIGFGGVDPEATGRPSYQPSILLTLRGKPLRVLAIVEISAPRILSALSSILQSQKAFICSATRQSSEEACRRHRSAPKS